MDSKGHSQGPQEHDDIVAAEFVLGVLSKDEHAACARRAENEEAFRRKVDQWSRDLAPIADEITPITPPDRVRAQLIERLFKDQKPPSRKGFLAGIWGHAGLWRVLAVVAILAAVGLFYEMDRRTGELTGEIETARADLATARSTIVSLEQAVTAAQDDAQVADATMQELLTRASSVLTGTLASSDSPVVYRALYWADTQSLTLIAKGQSAPIGRDFELWLIDDGRPPLSLGVVARDSHHVIALPQTVDRTVVLRSAFIVSVEPLGGAVDGTRSGPIVAAGKLVHAP